MLFSGRLTALALVTALGGCALASDAPPSVAVVDVRLTGIGPTEQQLALTLCVTNPNDNEIAFRHVTADLDVSGTRLATGASDLAVRLPSKSSTLVPFAIVTTVQNLGLQLFGIVRDGGIDYRVHGTVTLTGLVGLTLPYSRSGHLDPLSSSIGLVDAVADNPVASLCNASPAS